MIRTLPEWLQAAFTLAALLWMVWHDAPTWAYHRESRTVFIAVLPETASLSAAYRAARGARFEFGEHGR